METALKTVPPTTFLSTSKWLKIAEIPEFAGEAVDPLYGKLGELGLKPASNLVFLYHWVSDNEMECRIGIPIAEVKSDPKPYEYKRTEEFRCVSSIYVGSMKGIGAAWEELMQTVKAQGLAATNLSREVYVKWVDFDSPENRTELQLGIQ